ncbi:hypothetical protein B0T19DRAFT_196402 [Cercophora scortea]|uniref:PaxU n=1 Tax=Cercophora scortea TaxID=314031 RepID=A0AAE0IPN1_9PEZI|nr:hypothetical protein B0T19DRAFT_196402 [Cercophora scortea]
MASATERESLLLGFTPLNPQVYFQDPPPLSSPSSPLDPTTVILYGWGDARPKHVQKYVDGYRTLYPSAKLVLIYSPILKALYQTLEARSHSMVPILETVLGRSIKSSTYAEDRTLRSALHTHASDRVLVHVMSNTGGINFAATLHAYQQSDPDAKPFPHQMLVCDSTPGSTHFLSNIAPWSRALALGVAGYLPWPFLLTQGLAAAFLGTLHGVGWLLGMPSAADFSTNAVNDPALSDINARKLYLYSKADDIIYWEDLEEHAAQARERGYTVDMEMFEGSPHVGHMRAHPEQYWAAIARTWKAAVGGKA